MKVITALGWYNKNNCGDESYKLAFPLVFPDYEFRFTEKLTPEIIGTSDAFILGGGDILSGGYLDQLAFVNKPKHIVSVSANNGIDVNKLVNFDNIIVRDNKSLDILKHKGITAKYKPDVAFALTPDPMRGRRIIRKEFLAQKKEQYDKTVAVIINGFLADAEGNHYDVRKFINFHKLAYDLGHVFDYTAASFVFVPFGQQLPWDDRTTNMWVAQKCKFHQKNIVIWNETSVQNVLDIIAGTNAVISTRLHSTIFSMVAKTPFIDIVHNHKNSWLLETVGKQQFSIPYDSFDSEKVKATLKQILWGNKELMEKELESLIDKQKTLLRGLSDVKLV